MRGKEGGLESASCCCCFPLSFSFVELSTYFFLLGLPLDLKVLRPWVHHTEEVGMRY